MHATENSRYIMFMVLAMAGFAIEDAVIKHLSSDLPVSQVLLLVGIGGMTAFVVIALCKQSQIWVPGLLNTRFLLRTFCELASAILFVTAIVYASLSASTAILQATPLAVAFGGAVFLKQAVTLRQWILIALGFLGVLMIVQPGSDAFQPATLFAVAGVIFLAMRDVITRSISNSIPPLVISFWAFFALFLSGIVTTPVFGPFVTVGWNHIGWLALSSVAGSLAYLSVVMATRGGDVAVIAPFRYSRLLFALVLSVLLFDEILTLPVLIGSAMIIVSGLLTLRLPSRKRPASGPVDSP
jgi:drug/metabolite transporter (DMT)-like permease